MQVVDGNNIEVVANAGGAGASASGAGGREARKRVNNFAGSNNNQIVTNLSFTETFDGDKLAYVVEHWDQLDGLAAATLQEDGFQPSLDRARRYLEASQDMRVTVTYHQVGDTDIGRCYAKRGLSLQSLPRKVRHTVASGAYTDVDMVNAFPVLLLHECRKAGIECPYLAQYVAEREDLLAELPCSRDVAKKTYLAVMNGGNKDVNNLKELNQTTPHLLGFQTEMKCVYKKFAELHPAKYATVVERRTKQHKSYNHEAGLVTTILCELENQVLMTIWDFFGRPLDCVFCFDGIMLRADREYDLVACQLEVQKKLDVEIQLKAKPFDEQLQLPTSSSMSSYAKYMQLHGKKQPFNSSTLKQLLSQCSQRWIERHLTQDEMEQADAGDDRLLVKKKYAKHLDQALGYLLPYLLVVKGSEVTYIHVDYDEQGRECKRVLYKNQRALLENWSEYQYEIVNSKQKN